MITDGGLMKRSMILFALAAFIPAALFGADMGGEYHKITAKEAKAMMDKGGVTIVDVRTLDEYNAGHIPGAILGTVQTLEDTAPTLLKDKDAVILVYCRTGIRSANAAKLLLKLGYNNVYDIAGGITQWPYEVTKAQK